MPQMPLFLERTVQRLLAQQARVTQVETGPGSMRAILLEGRDVQKIKWTPGDSIKVFVGGGALRTYTPADCQAEQGLLRLLVHLHGNGPGSNWAAGLKVGDRVAFMKPERSLKPPRKDAQLIVFGDETALALATACRLLTTKPVLGFFEMADPEAAKHLPNLIVRRKKPDETHLDELVQDALSSLKGSGAVDVILAGRAAALGPIRRALQANRQGDVKLQMKVYWAEGKRGLD